jgi:ribosomal protein S12 methylthiotransferase accessory factor YcaO
MRLLSPRARRGLAAVAALMVDAVAELYERLLTPSEGANLEAGKAVMRRIVEEAQAQFTAAFSRRREKAHDVVGGRQG